jgi:hypothetical protein
MYICISSFNFLSACGLNLSLAWEQFYTNSKVFMYVQILMQNFSILTEHRWTLELTTYIVA